MDNQYWINRWVNKETGWHQSEVEPALIEWAKQLKPCTILVPFSGKSLDVLWLSQNGFHVIGVEISKLACDDFFKENKLNFETISEGEFKVYKSNNITIYNGDFFSLTQAHLKNCLALYDRAALIALPHELRPKYTKHMNKLFSNIVHDYKFNFLQIILTRSPHDLTGPPYSVLHDEITTYYGEFFSIKLKSKEKAEARGPEGSITEESVYYLNFK